LRDIGIGITQATPQIAADIGGTFERAARIKTKPAFSQKALKNDINSNCYLFKDTYVISSALATSGSIVRWFRDELESTANKEREKTYDRMFASLIFDGGTLMAVPILQAAPATPWQRGLSWV